MNRLLARLVLILFSLLLALGLSEAALRLLPLPDLRVLSLGQAPPASAWKDPAWGDPPDRAFQRQRTIGHEHRPDVDLSVPLIEHEGGAFHFQTNNLGLRRSAPTPTDKPAGITRVLVLGDSQTDGYVDNPESFSSLLETSLRAEGRAAEVLNGGVAGYSPAQEYLWYDVHGAELQPDLVVVGFYPGNDVLDLLDPAKPNVDPASGRAIRPREEEVGGGDGPLDSLRLGLLARYAIQVGPLAGLWRQLGLPGRLEGAGGYSTDTLTQVFRLCHGCYLQSLQQAVRARRDPAAMRDTLTRASAILARLDRDVRDHSGRLAVVILPTRAQVEPDLARPAQQQVAGLLGLGPADLAYEDEVTRTVGEQLAAAGVPTLPLRDPLREAAGPEPLYYSRDWHLNARGHRAAAAALGQGLAALGLLPAR
jgi:lysophospholipase L1-like esterase